MPSPETLVSQYCVLIRNEGANPIEDLNCIYPRSLYTSDSGDNWKIRGIRLISDLGEIVPSLLPDLRNVDANYLQLIIPHPGDPSQEMPFPPGRWTTSGVSLQSPPLRGNEIFQLRKWNATFFRIRFSDQLIAGQAAWVFFDITSP